MNFFDSLMAPLGKEHCAIYYIFGLLSLLMGFLAIVRAIIAFTNKKEANLGLMLVFHALSMFLFYYLYRILYSICSRSLV